MRRLSYSVAAMSALLAGAVPAFGQTTSTTTTTWTPDQGTTITQYSTTQKNDSFNDVALVPAVGMVLPATVAIYPLPASMVVPSPELYEYGIINNQPVIVDRATRRVVHVWTSTTAPQ